MGLDEVVAYALGEDGSGATPATADDDGAGA